MEPAAAPEVGPADDWVLLPAQLHDHQVSDGNVSGDEERQSGVAIQDRPAGWKQEQRSKVSFSDWKVPSTENSKGVWVCVSIQVYDILLFDVRT